MSFQVSIPFGFTMMHVQDASSLEEDLFVHGHGVHGRVVFRARCLLPSMEVVTRAALSSLVGDIVSSWNDCTFASERWLQENTLPAHRKVARVHVNPTPEILTERLYGEVKGIVAGWGFANVLQIEKVMLDFDGHRVEFESGK